MNDIYYEQISVDIEDGPWTIDEFSQRLKEQEAAAKRRITDLQSKMNKDNKFSFSRISLDFEYGYGDSRTLYMTVYRTKSPYEVRRDKEAQEAHLERERKIKVAAEIRAKARKKRKEELEKNKEYVQYKALQKKLKEQKII